MSPKSSTRGQGCPGLLAHVLIAKFRDHVPLYRQAEIYARDGVDLDRAMLADWVGKAAWLVKPLAERIVAHLMAGSVIHADGTPGPVLAPGHGKTKTGRFWVYLRDERPHAGAAPPAVLYRYTHACGEDDETNEDGYIVRNANGVLYAYLKYQSKGDDDVVTIHHLTEEEAIRLCSQTGAEILVTAWELGKPDGFWYRPCCNA